MYFTSLLALLPLFSSSLAAPATADPSPHLVDDLEARQTAVFQITGVTGGGNQPRLEIRQLQQNAAQFNIYLLALQAFQQTVQTNKLSYYSIMGIHGVPFVPWDSVPQAADGGGGYCTHSSNLFPTWHRPYVALYEQVLVAQAQSIAAKFPAGTLRTRYTTAANTLRVPYWDWAAAPPAGQSVMAPIMQQPTVQVVTPTGTKTINNPLYQYTFHPLVPSDIMYSPFNAINETVRGLQSINGPFVTNEAAAASAVDSNRLSHRDRLYNLFTNYNNYTEFSNMAWIPSNNPGGLQYDSLESVHGDIHTEVGDWGHMTWIEFSAYDPSFMLHHAMVDRCFALWQALYPNSWVEPMAQVQGSYFYGPGDVMTSSSPLEPFHKDSAGNFWTSDQVRSTSTFGYTYPEFTSGNSSINALMQKINVLYGNPLASPGTANTTTSGTGNSVTVVESSSASSSAPASASASASVSPIASSSAHLSPSSSAAPIASSSAAPIASSSVAPIRSSSAAPIPSSSAAPIASSSAAPIPSSSATPIPSSSVAPIASSSAAPIRSSSAAPIASSSKAPIASSSAAPIASSSAAPIASSSAAPIASSSAAPIASSSAAPVASSSAASIASSSAAPIASSSAAPITSSSAAPIASSSAAPVASSSAAPASSSATPIASSSAAPIASSSAAPVASSSPAPASSSAAPIASSSVAPIASSSAAPIASSSVAPIASSSAAPIASSSVGPIASSSAAPIASSSVAPIASSSAAPIAGSSAAPTVSSTGIPLVSSTTIPIASSSAQSSSSANSTSSSASTTSSWTGRHHHKSPGEHGTGPIILPLPLERRPKILPRADPGAPTAQTVQKATGSNSTTSATYREYIANIRSEKFGLGTSYTIYIFLGNFSANPTTWIASPNLAGTQSVFVPKVTNATDTGSSCTGPQCFGSIVKVPAAGVLVSGTVPLTTTLTAKVGDGELQSLAEECVIPYLKDNLHWRVTTAGSNQIDIMAVPDLEVSVVSAELMPATAADTFPVWGDMTVHADITDSQPGGMKRRKAA